MRIAQFAESYPPVINGAAVAVNLLSEELEKRHAVVAYAARYPGYRDVREVRRFPSYPVPHVPDYPLAWPWSPRLFREFRERRFDVVHTHSPFAMGQVGLRWARRCGIPVVTTYHTLYVEYAHYAPFLPQGSVRRFLQGVSAGYCNACDAVAAPTEPVREVLLEYGVKRPISVIPTGLKLRPPPAADPDYPRGALRIPADALLVLYTGRLAREKNLPLLFDAFDRAAREAPRAWLLVCGSGPAEAEARRHAGQTGAAARIVFAGMVPTERMAQVYAAADVFAFASPTDTQGLVLTEAKAAGLPAVTINAYGPSTVVKDGVDGFLVPNEPQAFADALLRLLRDEALRARMREAALREVRRFSIEATAEAYERLYEGAARILSGIGRGERTGLS